MSNYPGNIDDSVSLPIIRNNIVEAGTDTINKIRNAIVAIERTLGLDPQGSRSSLSQRLDNLIDDNGDLKSSSLSNLGLISGPISDSDISANAGISESKMNLVYSTEYLQTQISIINSTINNIYSSLSSVKSSLILHISSQNAHLASAINVTSILNTDNIYANLLGSNNLQSFLDESINSHFNFSEKATDINKSHSSSQIYIDTSNISNVYSANLQDAMVELSLRDLGSYGDLLHNYNNSHFPTSSVILGRGIVDELIVSGIAINFLSYSPIESRTGSVITLNPSKVLSITYGDTCEIYGDKFVISSIEYDGSKVKSLFLENFFPLQNASEDVSFFKKIKDYSSSCALVSQAIRKTSQSTKSIVQVVNPDSACIVADSSPKYGEITSGSLIVSLSGLNYSFAFSSVSSIDELIDMLNDKAVTLFAPVLFFKLGEKLCLSSLLIGEGETIQIIESSNSDLGLNNLGIVEPTIGNIHLIGRNEFHGLNKLLNKEYEILNDEIISSSDNFISLGIRTSLSVIVDKKRYFISDVSSGKIILSGSSIPDGNYNVYCYDDSTSVSYLSLDSYFGASNFEMSICDGYLNSENRVSLIRYCDYTAPYSLLISSDILADIEIINDELKDEELTFVMKIKENDPNLYINVGGEDVLFGSGGYFYYGENSIRVFSNRRSELFSYLVANGSATYPRTFDFKIRIIKGELKEDLSLFRCKVGKSSLSISELYSYVNKGFIRSEDRSLELMAVLENEKLMLHKTSVINGLKITNTSLSNNNKYVVSISGGVILFDGKFLNIESQTINSNIESTSTSTSLFLSCDKYGNITLSDAASNCSFSLSRYNNFVFASIDYYLGSFYTYDLTNYHVSQDDFMIGNVFVDPDNGSVKTFGDAVKLCKRYYDAFGIYPGKIILSPKVHTLTLETSELDTATPAYTNSAWDSGIYIDFPIEIEGSGESTILDFKVNSALRDDQKMASIIISYGETDPLLSRPRSSFVSTKVKFKNLTLKNTNVQIRNLYMVEPDRLSAKRAEFSNVLFSVDDNVDNNKGAIEYYLDQPAKITGGLKIADCRFENYNINMGVISGKSILELHITSNTFVFKVASNMIDHGGAKLSKTPSNNLNVRNILIKGNSNLGVNGSKLTNDIEWLDFDTAMRDAYGLHSSVLTCDGTSSFSGSSTAITSDSFSVSSASAFFYGANPLYIWNKNSSDVALDLANGRIQGLQPVRFTNRLTYDITNNTTHYFFSFSDSLLVPRTTFTGPLEGRIRLNSSSSTANGLYLKNISVNVHDVPVGDDFRVFIWFGEAEFGSNSFVDLGTGNNIYPSSSYAGDTLLISPSDSMSSRNFDIDTALSHALSSFSSRYINKKSFVMGVGVSLDRVGTVTLPITISVDMEMK